MPRMTVMGRWRHHSSSWGLKASCLDLTNQKILVTNQKTLVVWDQSEDISDQSEAYLTWTLGVGGRSWSRESLGSSDLRSGLGTGYSIITPDIELLPGHPVFVRHHVGGDLPPAPARGTNPLTLGDHLNIVDDIKLN